MTESRAVQQMRQDIEDLLRNRKSLRSVLDLSLTEIVTELTGEKEYNASLVDQKQHLIEKANDLIEIIRHAAEHDDPKRVLREFVAARPKLFGERKDI